MTNGLEIMELSDLAHLAPAGGGGAAESTLEGRRVLVVHGESSVRWAYVGLLRGAGARVTEARNGVEALQLASSARPELIVAALDLQGLDGRALFAALQNEPDLADITVVLLADGEPPKATWDTQTGSAPLVGALMVLLRELWPEPENGEPEPENDASDREDLRAQSTVALYREPANRTRRSTHPVWRIHASPEPRSHATRSGFDWELRVMSRILGAGFLTLVAATIGLIAWRLVTAPLGPEAPEKLVTAAELSPGVDVPTPSAETPAVAVPLPSAPAAPASGGLFEFSGVLRPSLDPALGAGPGQGVLELFGPAKVRVVVDGIDRGSLPVSLVVDQGRHQVRYSDELGFADRFYFVKAGSTRSARVLTRPGGFVDAR